jgi:hypothetical protein
MRKTLTTSVLVIVAVLAGGQTAGAVTLDFETLTDLQPVTSQFEGLTFTNATALSSGAVAGSLNEFDFPPLSGVTVVSDDGGAISIVFDTLVSEVSGFFNYLTPVTITAFDALLVPVAGVTSAFGSNLALSGEPGSSPNELLQLTFADGIASLTLQGDPAGFSFTLDSFSYEPVAATPVPAALFLVSAALFTVPGWPALRCRREGPRSSVP